MTNFVIQRCQTLHSAETHYGKFLIYRIREAADLKGEVQHQQVFSVTTSAPAARLHAYSVPQTKS